MLFVTYPDVSSYPIFPLFLISQSYKLTCF